MVHTKKKFLGVGLAVFGVGLCLGVQLTNASAGYRDSAEWFVRLSLPASRSALSSGAGRAFMSALGVADTEALAALLSISGGSARGRRIQVLAREMDEQLGVLTRETGRFREIVRARQIEAAASGDEALARALGQGLEAGEIEMARLLGERIFRVLDTRRLRAVLARGEADFVGLEAATRTGAPRTFLRAVDDGAEIFERIARARVQVAETAARQALAGTFQNRWSSWFSHMNSCLESRPPDETLRQQIFYWTTEIGIEESITVSSRVLGQATSNYAETGVWNIDLNNVDWDGIDIDMVVTVFATAFSGTVLSTSNRYRVQWMRYTAAQIGADNTLDAVLYFISPAERITQQDPALPEASDVAGRFGLSTAFSLGNTWHEVGVYRIADGLSCLFNGNWRVKAGLLGARVLYSVGVHSAYFGLRYTTLEQ